MVDFVLDWAYIPDVKSVVEAIGHGTIEAMSNYNKSATVPIKPSIIASNHEKAKWREIYEDYLTEIDNIEWEWEELEREARRLNVETMIQAVRQQKLPAELQQIQLDQHQQQHTDLVALHKRALSLKEWEFTLQQRQYQGHLLVMSQVHQQQVNQKLNELNVIKERHNSGSSQSRTATQKFLLHGRNYLLLNHRNDYQVLVLVAPPAIAEDPEIPEKLRGNLPFDLQDNIKEFLAEHYSLESNASVECHGDYFKEPISTWRLRELFHILQPIPTIALYPKLKERTLTFQLGYWGISGDAEAVEFPPNFSFKWPELLAALLEKGLTEQQAVQILRKTIVNLHCLVAGYLVDLHYLAIDPFAFYQPRLFELETEYSLVAPQWAACVEMLRQVQQVRQKICQTWKQEQDRIRELQQQQRQEQERQQIDRWCCRETLGENKYFGWVNAVAYSPDGRTLAGGYFDRTIKLWAFNKKLKFWTVMCTFEGHSNHVNTIAYSPDGKLLASGSDDTTIKLWDVATGQCLRTFEGYRKEVKIVAYSPEGNTLASGSCDETIKIWDVKTGLCLHTLESDYRSSITSLAYSPDGRTLASGGALIQLWNVATGSHLQTFRLGCSGWVDAIAFSPDGQILASASEDKTIKLWHIARGESFATLQGHSRAVQSVAFSPDGKTLASASLDHTVKLWDWKKKRCLRNLTGHTHVVNTVAYSPNGNTLASGSYDQTIKIWGFPAHENLI